MYLVPGSKHTRYLVVTKTGDVVSAAFTFKNLETYDNGTFVLASSSICCKKSLGPVLLCAPGENQL